MSKFNSKRRESKLIQGFSFFFLFALLFLGTVQSILLHPITVQDNPKSMNA